VEQPEEQNVFFFFSLVSNTSVPCRLSVRTKSVVDIHERSVLRQLELCRDESEAKGDEEREHRCGFSVECQTALHSNESADDERLVTSVALVADLGRAARSHDDLVDNEALLASSVALASGSSAAQSRSRSARFDDSQAHATQRGVDLVDNKALLAYCGVWMHASNSLPTGTPHATAAAKHVWRLNRTAALTPSSRSRGALIAARVRHAPRQRLVAQIGLRSVRERHDRSLEIDAAMVARSHEHALKHRRVSSSLDQRPLVDQCAVGQQELDNVDGAVECACSRLRFGR
jgi:hypothetical protein